MKENIDELYKKFLKIKNMGYVKSVRNGNTGVGATFEYLIGKKEDQEPEPDFKGIEIKTKMYHTKTDINLFSANPSGNNDKESYRLARKYGYPDKIIRHCNILNCCAFGNKNTLVANKYLFKLNVDRCKNKIILEIRDLDGNILDKSTYWDLDKLKIRVENKLNILAFVKALRKINSNITYYKYYSIKFYKLRDFDTFLNLIENGYIRVVFKIGVFRSVDRFGDLHDHGTSFQISQDNINRLYIML